MEHHDRLRWGPAGYLEEEEEDCYLRGIPVKTAKNKQYQY